MRIVVVILFCLFFGNLQSQSSELGVSYTYLYAKQWDKIIQTYNFSRPFLSEKQPLLQHGLSASLHQLFKPRKRLKHGLAISYTYFGSHAENEYYENKLNFHVANLAYVVRLDHQHKFEGFSTDFQIGLITSALNRRVNHEPVIVDKEKMRAFGVGADVSLRLGYNIRMNQKITLVPFVQVGYTPYYYAPNMENVINETKGLIAKDWTGIFMGKLGFALQLVRYSE